MIFWIFSCLVKELSPEMYEAFEGEAIWMSENDFSSAPSSLSRSITGLLSIGGRRIGTSGDSESILTFSRPLAIDLFP